MTGDDVLESKDPRNCRVSIAARADVPSSPTRSELSWPSAGIAWWHAYEKWWRTCANLRACEYGISDSTEGPFMKWGIAFASTSFPHSDEAVTVAQAAEEAGFESLWCPEHVVVGVGENATPYGASPDGKMDRLWRRGGIPDPLIWLAFIASQTTRINLGTNVIALPEHQPVVFAKSAATLDALCGGRFRLGIGVGNHAEEYEACGMDFTNRGRRMDEYIQALRLLWREEVASFSGRYVQFNEVRCDPSPTHGGIPLHIGGASDAAISRAARFGDGYFPWVPPGLDLYETLERVIGEVRSEATRLGRSPDDIEMTAGGARSLPEVERMASLGVDRLVIAVRAKEMGAVHEELAAFGEEVIRPSRDL
jgi:probable F420-dependent oxidoreductase